MQASYFSRGAVAAAFGALVLSCALASSATGADSAVSASAQTATAAAPGELLVRRHGGEERTIELKPGADLLKAAKSFAGHARVDYAVPNYIAHAAGRMIPNDPGSTQEVSGWTVDQWNFLGGAGGVAIPIAWDALRDANLPGGAVRGRAPEPTVAVIDTGIAYTSAPPYRRSPDFRLRQFVPGRDFVDRDPVPADENGHGTHIAGTIAAQVDDSTSFTGLAYGVRMMPVRVLDESGAGTADDIRAGILWAVDQGADLINLSLEFDPGVTSCAQVPGVCNAIARARKRRVAVVAAAGNGGADGLGDSSVAYPGAVGIAVGATTVRGCLARYSNWGGGLDMVAPGGGRDSLAPDSQCQALSEDNPEIVQLSFAPGGGLTSFAAVGEHGTSMASAHVTGIAALVLATRQLNRKGRPPTVARLEAHLKKSSRPLGEAALYGAGLINAPLAIKPRLRARQRR